MDVGTAGWLHKLGGGKSDGFKWQRRFFSLRGHIFPPDRWGFYKREGVYTDMGDGTLLRLLLEYVDGEVREEQWVVLGSG